MGAHAAEIVRSQRLVAHLLDRIIAGARNRFGRHVAGMQRGIMVTQPERETVGKAARFAHLLGGKIARGQRYTAILAAGGLRIGAPRPIRTEARRVGEEGVRTCSSRWWTCH